MSTELSWERFLCIRTIIAAENFCSAIIRGKISIGQQLICFYLQVDNLPFCQQQPLDSSLYSLPLPKIGLFSLLIGISHFSLPPFLTSTLSLFILIFLEVTIFFSSFSSPLLSSLAQALHPPDLQVNLHLVESDKVVGRKTTEDVLECSRMVWRSLGKDGRG